MATAHDEPRTVPIPDIVDWLVATILAVVGMVLTVAGGAVLLVVDKDLIAEKISGGDVTVVLFERTLTDAQATSLAADVLHWTGIGLLVTGIGLTVFAVGYGIARYRRDDSESMPGWRAAVCGAVTTGALSFLPFSPVFGGAVAGYLDVSETGLSMRLGALSGVLAAVPAVIVGSFVTVGVYDGLSVVGDDTIRALTLAFLVGGTLITVAISAGLGALGGYAGEQFGNRER